MSENRWGLPFEPTDDQVRAIEEIAEWWNESDSQVFRLFGYAGTGKTSIAIYLPHILGLLESTRYRFGAYSGKAVNVLQTKMVKANKAWDVTVGAALMKAPEDVDPLDLAGVVLEEAGARPASPEYCATLHKLLYGPPIDLKKENAALEAKIEVLRSALNNWEQAERQGGNSGATFWSYVVEASRHLGEGRRSDLAYGDEDFTPADAREQVRVWSDQVDINTRTARARGWLYFSPQEQSPLAGGVDLLIADEVSMVSDDMAHDILSTGVRVLVLGDPEQLPPVRGNGYFVRPSAGQPDAMLSTVTRQAAGSPVLSIATQVRAGVDTSTWTTPWKDVDHASFAEADAMVLCWRRATRWGALRYIRENLLHRPAGVPVPGDKIMILANNSDIGVFNGQMFVVEEVEMPKAPAAPAAAAAVAAAVKTPFSEFFGPGYEQKNPFAALVGEEIATGAPAAADDAWDGANPDVIRLHVHEEGIPDSSTPLEVWKFGFLGDKEEKDARAQHLGERGKVALATFAQAVTVHKAQGSEWGRVLFIDEGRAMFSMEANRGGYEYAERQTRRFRYTAITRARDEITIVRKS